MNATMNAKHTPGPWNYSDDHTNCITGRTGFSVGPTGFTVAALHDETNVEADARLIAAAPELLEIARRVAAGGMSYPAYDRKLAEAAIAKATE